MIIIIMKIISDISIKGQPWKASTKYQLLGTIKEWMEYFF